MARFQFGGGIADWVFAEGDQVTIGALTGRTAVVLGGVNVTFWSDEQNGVQYTDLLDIDGQPITLVVSEDGSGIRATGQIPPFEGPDGITKMWAQAGEDGARALMVTTDAADIINDPGSIWPPLSVTGAVSVGAGAHRLYNDTTATLVLGAVRASLGTPGASNTVLDVNRNGTSIYSAQAERPTLAAGQNTTGKLVPSATIEIAPGDWITVDVDQAGTGARDLVLQLLMLRS